MADQLPAIVQPSALAVPTDTYIVPALIAAAGDQAGWRYVEFFTANIRNPHTRRAYARHAEDFSPGAKLAALRSRPSARSTWRPGLRTCRRNTGRRA
jgi:hypothetical protein